MENLELGRGEDGQILNWNQMLRTQGIMSFAIQFAQTVFQDSADTSI